MVRIIAFFVGLGFIVVVMFSMFTDLYTFFREPPAKSAEYVFHEHPRKVSLPSNGPFGHFDRQQLQRGFQVYKETCAACHGLSLVAFRNLHDLGYNEAEVRAIAEQWAIEVPDIHPDTGEAVTRPAVPADNFPSPYANEVAARAANNNAYPPDLSLIVKAREDGVNYVYSLLTGYRNPPERLLREFPEAAPGEGLYFNPYFHNLNIAMPPPLVSNGQVTYAPGNPEPTIDQMATDVTAFLVWAAEPSLERRHQYGLVAVVFLLFTTVISYFAYRNIWATAKRKVRVTGAVDPKNIAKSKRAKRQQGIKG